MVRSARVAGVLQKAGFPMCAWWCSQIVVVVRDKSGPPQRQTGFQENEHLGPSRQTSGALPEPVRARAWHGAFRERMSACQCVRRWFGSEQPMGWSRPASCAGGAPGRGWAQPRRAAQPEGWPASRCGAGARLPGLGALLEFLTGRTWEMCVPKRTAPFGQVKLQLLDLLVFSFGTRIFLFLAVFRDHVRVVSQENSY